MILNIFTVIGGIAGILVIITIIITICKYIIKKIKSWRDKKQLEKNTKKDTKEPEFIGDRSMKDILEDEDLWEELPDDHPLNLN